MKTAQLLRRGLCCSLNKNEFGITDGKNMSDRKSTPLRRVVYRETLNAGLINAGLGA